MCKKHCVKKYTCTRPKPVFAIAGPYARVCGGALHIGIDIQLNPAIPDLRVTEIHH